MANYDYGMIACGGKSGIADDYICGVAERIAGYIKYAPNAKWAVATRANVQRSQWLLNRTAQNWANLR